MSDKRDQNRRRVLKAGTIAFAGSTIDCIVRNISSSGAALEVESQLSIPASFQLLIAAEQFREHCRVLWRKANRLGVVFEGRKVSARSAPSLVPVLPHDN